MKNYIPDRSAASLRTAFRRFQDTTRTKFVKSAYKTSSSRFSHQFEDTPESVSHQITSTKKKVKDSCVKNLDKFYNSASTKVPPEEEPLDDEPSGEMPQVDLNVMTNQPSLVDNKEDIEFLLEIGDMQSAISNHFASDTSYSMKANRKRHRLENLDEIYTTHDQKMGHKRVKLDEADTKVFEYSENDSTIYDQASLYEHIRSEAKIKITSNLLNSKRSVHSNVNNNDNFFQKITEELNILCERYDYSMEEMHAMFMQA